MRNAFADELTKISSEDKRIVLLSADIGNKLFDKMKLVAPTRVINTGVAEANTIGVAAGLAMSGMKPIAYTITPFITIRCLEQIKIDLAYQDVPVIVVGTGSGLSYATLGATHHSLEDISFLRTIPNMIVLAPADSNELRALLREALKEKSPVYMRIGKKGEPTIYNDIPAVKIGKAHLISKPSHANDVCILSAGNMLATAVAAAKKLEEEGIGAQVVSFHTIKPLDKEFLKEIFSKFKAVATVEEHSLVGGFGAAVAEWLADFDASQKEKTKARLLRFATKDEFFHTNVDQEYAREISGLTAENMAARIKTTLKIS